MHKPDLPWTKLREPHRSSVCTSGTYTACSTFPLKGHALKCFVFVSVGSSALVFSAKLGRERSVCDVTASSSERQGTGMDSHYEMDSFPQSQMGEWLPFHRIPFYKLTCQEGAGPGQGLMPSKVIPKIQHDHHPVATSSSSCSLTH